MEWEKHLHRKVKFFQIMTIQRTGPVGNNFVILLCTKVTKFVFKRFKNHLQLVLKDWTATSLLESNKFSYSVQRLFCFLLSHKELAGSCLYWTSICSLGQSDFSLGKFVSKGESGTNKFIHPPTNMIKFATNAWRA